MIRFETYRSCEPQPAPERAFVTVGDIITPDKNNKMRTSGHMTFYGETEQAARTAAYDFVAAERARIEQQELSKAERLEKARLERAAKSTPQPSTSTEE